MVVCSAPTPWLQPGAWRYVFHSRQIRLTRLAAHPLLHEPAHRRGAEHYHAVIVAPWPGHESVDDEQGGQRSQPLDQPFLEAKAGIARCQKLTERRWYLSSSKRNLGRRMGEMGL